MKKKVLAAFLVAAMTASMAAGCGSSDQKSGQVANTEGGAANDGAEGDGAAEGGEENIDFGSGDIKIWVSQESSAITKELAEKFIADNGFDYTVTVESVGEGDAASNMITDVEGGADIYGFAQDQISRLVSAGALQQLTGTGYDEWAAENNDAGAIGAATVGSTLWALPLTSDNGYFLYYDKEVVKDPTSLEAIVADCEAAGKNFYFEINSGWYQTAFFFGTGCTLEYTTDDKGSYTGCTIDYASDAGLVALKEIIELKSSPSFQNGSTVSKATKVGAIASGTWDSKAAQDLFKENYACAALPHFEGSDGKTYELGGFGGFKLLGIKPQTEAGKLQVCVRLAQYLTDTEAQLKRFEKLGWGPSNLTAQADAGVQSNVALSALAQQLAKDETIPQGQYPDDYWKTATSLGDDVIQGNLSADSSDDDLMAALQKFSKKCESFAKAK